MINIRNASIEDAERILEIYAYYVKNTAISFECEVPSIDGFKNRMKKTMEWYPYFVIERDGIVQGYAYAGPFVDRGAYDRSCEVSIYLDRDAWKRGMGRMIYEVLETELQHMGIINLYARIAYPGSEDEYLDKNSAEFHEHLGFAKVGELHNCGHKFGHWYNMVCMEKIIGEHTEKPLPVKK